MGQSSTPLSLALFTAAVIAYTLSMVTFAVALVFRRKIVSDIALGLAVVGWPLHALSIVSRGIEGQHWPLGDMYEYSTGISFVVITTALVLMIRSRMRQIGLAATIVTVALLGVGYMTYVPPDHLVPALHSYWLTIHVTSMATSSGLLTFSFLFGMGYLVRRWADERLLATATVSTGGGGGKLVPSAAGAGGGSVALAGGGARSGLASRLTRVFPRAKVLDDWSARFVMIGFPIWSFGVICGAIWGEQAWGRYWGWDPKETFAFITWVIFAIYLHARVTYGWKGKRAAAITAVGFVAILFTLYAVNLWIAGLHSYAKA